MEIIVALMGRIKDTIQVKQLTQDLANSNISILIVDKDPRTNYHQVPSLRKGGCEPECLASR